MKTQIQDYYDKLAPDYDKDRFSNTYGRYIHQQEQRLVERYLDKKEAAAHLDLACGTGRFLEYARVRADISPEMLAVAQQKYPEASLHLATADALPFPDAHFQKVLSFHLFMHLQAEDWKPILKEIHRVLKPGGRFLFDIPLARRRKLLSYKVRSWHGANSLFKKALLEQLGSDWELVDYQGGLPIHRIPKALRGTFLGLDNWLITGLWKEYASHLLFILQKR